MKIEKKLYALYDRGNKSIFAVFTAKNDFTALQMNLHALESPDAEIDKTLFSIVCLGTFDDESLAFDSEKRLICRLSDCKSELDKLIAELDVSSEF